MHVTTRSTAKASRARSTPTDVSPSSPKINLEQKKSLLSFIARVAIARLGRADKKRGVIRKTFKEYNKRYEWVTERQLRYHITQVRNSIAVPSAVPFSLTVDDTPLESMNRDDTARGVSVVGVEVS